MRDRWLYRKENAVDSTSIPTGILTQVYTVPPNRQHQSPCSG